MLLIYDTNAQKRATNLSINSDLLNKAKQLNINLSATLEQAFVDKVRAQQEKLWREQNQNAISAYNNNVDAQGVFSDDLRSF